MVQKLEDRVPARVRADQAPPPRVSVVAPCYNEEEVLPEFYRRCSAACRAEVGDDYELVLVDDGSRDGTRAMIRALSDSDPRVVGVLLARNHGHQLAVTAGLSVAMGDRVMLIDADLQDPPELLGEMMRLMDRGADVVYGQRSSRQGETLFKRTTAKLFYRLLSKMTRVEIPADTGDFRLMNRRVTDVRVTDVLVSMPERHRFIRGMVGWIGGVQVPLSYERHARFAGQTKYPLRKMVRFAVDAITSFSILPLRFAVLLGMACATGAIPLFFYTLVQWQRHSVVSGWASLMTAVTFFSGVQLMVLGILGEYLGRLVEENKRRPLFLIDQVVRRS